MHYKLTVITFEFFNAVFSKIVLLLYSVIILNLKNVSDFVLFDLQSSLCVLKFMIVL